MKTLRSLIVIATLSFSSITSAQCGPFTFSSIIGNNPTCYGFSDGSFSVSTVAGLGALTFVLEDSLGNVLNVGNSNTANSLPAGWYYFSVTDQLPCTISDSILLVSPGEMTIDLTVNEVLCNGDDTAWARVDEVYNYTGNVSQIGYFWNPNPASIGGIGADSSYNMFAGNYSITINDENGCSTVHDFTVSEPNALYFIEFSSQPAECRLFGYQNGGGLVYADAGGGDGTYDFQWENLGTGQTSNFTTWAGLNPGEYEITVTDGNGCQLIDTTEVDSLTPIADFTVVSSQLDAGLNGLPPIDVTFNNQSTDFANPNDPFPDTIFYWNYGFAGEAWKFEPSLSSMDTTYTATGTYDACLVVVNKNGCADTLCKTINAGAASIEEIDNSLLIYPNPNQGELSIQLDANETSVISVYNALGQIIYSKTHTSNLINLSLGKIEDGIYTVHVARENEIVKGVFVVE